METSPSASKSPTRETFWRRASLIVLVVVAGVAAVFADALTKPWYPQPPPRYRGSNVDQITNVVFIDRDAVEPVCRHFGAPARTAACTVGRKVMILPNPCPVAKHDRYAALLCHELGHVNGWPATHPAN